MRLAYLGTPEMAVAPLEALVAAGHEIVLVVTRPDARRGRGSATTPSPVAQCARRLGCEISHDVEDLIPLARSGALELAVVVAYGRILKPHLLDACLFVNLHFSLLPRWRGAAPVERAILAGDAVTGVCLMQIDEGLDTGGVYDRREVPIGPETTAAELRRTLVQVGADMLVDNLQRGLGVPQPQVGDVSIAAKITPEDLRIDWSQPPAHIHRVIRLGGAWTTFREARIRILSARLLDGELEILEMQPEGKRPMALTAWRNGVRLGAGEWFT